MALTGRWRQPAWFDGRGGHGEDGCPAVRGTAQGLYRAPGQRLRGCWSTEVHPGQRRCIMTTRIRTTLIAAGATGMLAGVLASCGSSGTQPNTAAPSATAPPATTTAPHGGVMDGTNCAVPALPGQ